MASLVDWDSDLSLGLRQIDEHHEHLLGMLNRCYSALMLHNNHHEVETVIAELCDYTRYHFEEESTLMFDLGYPEASSHLGAHAYFTGAVLSFRDRSRERDSLLGMDVLLFLKEWLVDHIKQSDRALAEFIKESAAT